MGSRTGDSVLVSSTQPLVPGSDRFVPFGLQFLQTSSPETVSPTPNNITQYKKIETLTRYKLSERVTTINTSDVHLSFAV